MWAATKEKKVLHQKRRGQNGLSTQLEGSNKKGWGSLHRRARTVDLSPGRKDRKSRIKGKVRVQGLQGEGRRSGDEVRPHRLPGKSLATSAGKKTLFAGGNGEGEKSTRETGEANEIKDSSSQEGEKEKTMAKRNKRKKCRPTRGREIKKNNGGSSPLGGKRRPFL